MRNTDLSTMVTIRQGKGHHVYHDVFDDVRVFVELDADRCTLEFDEERGAVTIGLHRDLALEMAFITAEEHADVDLKLLPVGDQCTHRCTNGHGACGTVYPSARCPWCVERER